MSKMVRYFKSHVVAFLFALLSVATVAWGLTSSEIFSHPASTTSAQVVNRSLSTLDVNFLHEIMAGNVEGHTYRNVRGHSHSVGTADQEISALNAAGFGNWPSAAAGAVIVSDDAQDNAAGTGARSIIVRGLDDVGGEWVAATATIVPTGVTPTTVTSQTFIRINEIEVVTAGSGLTNAGVITVSISGTDIMEIYEDHSTSDAGRITIASGEEGHFQNQEASAIGTKAMTYHIFCRDNTVADAPFLLRASWHSLDGGYRPDGLLDVFTEKTDIVFIGHAILAGARASASVEGWTEVVE